MTTPDEPKLWIERVGTRHYRGFSERGGVVEVADASTPDAFAPGELLKIALAGCTALTSDAPLERRLGEDFEARIDLSGPKNTTEEYYPKIFEKFQLDLSALDASAQERLLTVIKRAIDQACTVGRTLERGTSIELEITSVK